MAELTSLNIKIDRDIKRQADILFNEMGMTLTTAVNIFVRQTLQEQAIPFKITVDGDKFSALKAKEALKALQDGSMQNGKSNMAMDEIDAIIAAARRDRRKNRG